MQAPQYTRSTGFAEDELANVGGRATVRADRLDAELDDISASVNALQENQELIQRDDGKLRDAVVELHTVSAAVAAMFGGSDFVPRGAWLTATAYAYKDLVEINDEVYVCMTAHTSGVFATDRAAGNWMLFPGRASAASISFSPTATLSSTDVQSAIEEVEAVARAQNPALLAFNYGAF